MSGYSLPAHFPLMKNHVPRYTGSVILRLTYGYDVCAENDHYVTLIERAVESILFAVHAGAFWVEYLPFLKHIPG